MSKFYLINTDKSLVVGIFGDLESAEEVAKRMRSNTYLGDLDDVVKAFKVDELHALCENMSGEEEAKQRSKAAYGERLEAICDEIDWSKKIAKRAKSKTSGACAKVHEIADSMPDAPRKDVIAECIKQGVNPGTASTQYQKWRAASVA